MRERERERERERQYILNNNHSLISLQVIEFDLHRSASSDKQQTTNKQMIREKKISNRRIRIHSAGTGEKGAQRFQGRRRAPSSSPKNPGNSTLKIK